MSTCPFADCDWDGSPMNRPSHIAAEHGRDPNQLTLADVSADRRPIP